MNDFDFADDLKALARTQGPGPMSRERLMARVSATRRNPPVGRASRWGLGLLAAAAVIFAALAMTADRSTNAVVLGGGTLELNQGVMATVQGRGEATTEGAQTHVTWTEGELHLDVTPAQGRIVSIETAEASVRVVGTVLTVDVDAFGTSVAVERGKVEVTCHALQTPELLEGGEDTLCLQDAGAGLGHLLMLEGSGSSPEARLEVIQRALEHPSGLDVTRRTLTERQIGALVELGRTEEAVAVASRMDASDRKKLFTERVQDALTMGVNPRGCAHARPWLEALAEEGDAIGALLLIQCLADEEPGEAAEVLDRIDMRTLTPLQAETARRWQEALR